MAKQTTKQKQKKVEAITGEELTQKVKELGATWTGRLERGAFSPSGFTPATLT